MVGMARFELATSCPPVRRANQATLHPEPGGGDRSGSTAHFNEKELGSNLSYFSYSSLGSDFGLGFIVSHRWSIELINRSPPALSIPIGVVAL